jgi:hypothetical protein
MTDVRQGGNSPLMKEFKIYRWNPDIPSSEAQVAELQARPRPVRADAPRRAGEFRRARRGGDGSR